MSRSYTLRLLTALLALAALAALAPGAAPARASLAPAPARVALLHAAPLPGSAPVTVAVDTAPGQPDLRLGDFGFGGSLDYRDVAAGTRTFKLYAGALDTSQLPGATPALTAQVALEAGKDYTIVATGGVNGFPLELLRLTDNTPRPTGASGKLRFVHAAPFAATLAATAVDIIAESGEAIPGLVNIRFRGTTDFLTRSSGVEFDLKAVPSGSPGAPALLDLPPFSLAQGEVVTFVAIGGANGHALALREFTRDEREPALLRVVQAAQYEGEDTPSPVDVLLNGGRRWSGLAFETITGATELDEGPYTITIQKPGDPPGFLAEVDAQLRRGFSYIALVRPGPDGQGVQVTVETESGPSDTSPPPGQGRLIVHHVAPFDTGDRGRLDLRNQRGELVAAILAAIRFGDRVVVDLPAREYDLRFTTAGGATLMADVEPFTLEVGEVVSLFVVGSKDGKPTGVLSDAGPIRQRTYLPLMER
jgi:hypothetical protein